MCCVFVYFFRGGKICLTDHFKPLWARNVPKFGIAHAMALGVRLCVMHRDSLSVVSIGTGQSRDTPCVVLVFCFCVCNKYAVYTIGCVSGFKLHLN